MVLPLQRFLDVDFMRINLATPTRSMAARAARPTSFLSCHRTSMWAPPPVGGTFQFQIFIQASSPEIWSETISAGIALAVVQPEYVNFAGVAPDMPPKRVAKQT